MTDAERLRRAGLRVTSARLARTGGNHHHIVCRQCGTVADVDCVPGHSSCLEPAASAGYAIDRAEVTFWGGARAARQPATSLAASGPGAPGKSTG